MTINLLIDLFILCVTGSVFGVVEKLGVCVGSALPGWSILLPSPEELIKSAACRCRRVFSCSWVLYGSKRSSTGCEGLQTLRWVSDVDLGSIGVSKLKLTWELSCLHQRRPEQGNYQIKMVREWDKLRWHVALERKKSLPFVWYGAYWFAYSKQSHWNLNSEDLSDVSCLYLPSYTALRWCRAVFPGSWGPVPAKYV